MGGVDDRSPPQSRVTRTWLEGCMGQRQVQRRERYSRPKEWLWGVGGHGDPGFPEPKAAMRQEREGREEG